MTTARAVGTTAPTASGTTAWSTTSSPAATDPAGLDGAEGALVEGDDADELGAQLDTGRAHVGVRQPSGRLDALVVCQALHDLAGGEAGAQVGVHPPRQIGLEAHVDVRRVELVEKPVVGGVGPPGPGQGGEHDAAHQPAEHGQRDEGAPPPPNLRPYPGTRRHPSMVAKRARTSRGRAGVAWWCWPLGVRTASGR